MPTLDTKGTFDAVLSGRLTQHLQDQDWPAKLVRWVSSFINGQSVCLQLRDFTSQAFQIPAGLPQGSPISPFLFMLFIKPPFQIGSLQAQHGRFEYADDICQIVASPSLEANIKALEDIAAELQQWGSQEGLLFDLSETEIQYFSYSCKMATPNQL